MLERCTECELCSEMQFLRPFDSKVGLIGIDLVYETKFFPHIIIKGKENNQVVTAVMAEPGGAQVRYLRKDNGGKGDAWHRLYKKLPTGSARGIC